MNLRLARPEDAEALAALHAAAAETTWPPALIADLLAGGTLGLLIEDAAPQAMILWRVAADEAEILDVAVDPRQRRRGLGRLLVAAAADMARAAGAASLFLEVAVDNAAARALYERLGFAQVGVRRGYYRRGADRIDALVLRCDLNTVTPSPYP